MQQTFLVQIIQRIGSSSPRFFKIIQIASFILSIAAGIMMELFDRNMMTIPNQEAWSELCQSLTTFFMGSGFASLMSTTKAELMDDKTKENVLKETPRY